MVDHPKYTVFPRSPPPTMAKTLFSDPAKTFNRADGGFDNTLKGANADFSLFFGNEHSYYKPRRSFYHKPRGISNSPQFSQKFQE